MENFKTNLIAAGKLVIALVFVGVKLANHQDFTAAEWTIIAALASGSVGNMFSADAKKPEAPKDTPPSA